MLYFDSIMLHFKKFFFIRYDIEQKFPPSLDEITKKIIKMERIPEDVVEVDVLKSCLEEYQNTFRIVSEFTKEASTKYDKLNPTHEKKLELLFETLMPNEPYIRISHNWKQLGFQGTDPATDFRSMGILALDCLVFLATTYPQQCHKIMKFQSPFPLFALVGIHITQLTLTLSKTRALQYLFYVGGPDKRRTWFQIYCYLVMEFEEYWILERRSVMDFETVFAQFEKIVKKKMWWVDEELVDFVITGTEY
ncbi:ELMO domain-containing protein 2 [Nowakowskiella sp. JEL0407]|nr:ELMO domain-containing protein 2 [Nowakowskiella sp. JEL0407]